MTMKVEIFDQVERNTKASELQKLINDWLMNNPDIHIEYITQSQVQHGQHMSMPLTICIWYTE